MHNWINNTDIDTAQDIDIVMPMYNLIEYSDNYSKTSRSLWQYYKDDPNETITQSESFKSELFVPVKYLSSFGRTLEMPLIYCEVNLILTWSPTCVISSATGETKFKITETEI